MTISPIGATVLILAAGIMTGFGVLTGILTIVLLVRRQEIKTLWTRFFAWFVIIPPLLIPLVLGRHAFQAVMLMLSLFCFNEYARATGLWKDRPLMIAASIAITVIFIPIFLFDYGFYQAFPVFAASFIIVLPIIRGRFTHMIQQTCLGILGIIYFGWFLSHVAYIRNLPHGIEYIFILIVLVESNDAFAYVWGKILGKHKLIPLISPNKTIEGALGALISVIVLALFLRLLVPYVEVPIMLLLAALVSVLGMLGDLVISFIKRDLSIKDTGSFIPGHGGLLDRFDSLILVAPAFFHFLRFFYYGT
ncbi:MAG: phosphatidate cytidylyltransferase [Spirochaetota bacterium]